MVVIPDLIPLLNVVLCLAIVVLGVIVYTRRESASALLVGVAFGLFGISHIYTILGLGSSWEGAMITVRTSGYILVIAALYLSLKEMPGRRGPVSP